MGCRNEQDYSIEPMLDDDWEAVRSIYLEGIATGNATFETQAPGWVTWDSNHRKDCRMVAKVGKEVLGWAALSLVSQRACYSGVAEVSVYVAGSSRGRGIGRVLLESLVAASEEAGLWTLQASIFPENTASIAVHKSCGFRELGRRERVAVLQGVWRDTVILERRSKVVGV
jgi:L-amino acid N-acyltransferase YncA